jgi:molybdenum cofactor biosynthesis protein B
LRTAVQNYAQALDIDAVLLTGGTGIAIRDQTPETIAGLFTKELPGYGELFRMLSYQEIGAAAMLSRAQGGLVGDTIVLTMPGSTAAVRLAMEKLILPELAHLVKHARK